MLSDTRFTYYPHYIKVPPLYIGQIRNKKDPNCKVRAAFNIIYIFSGADTSIRRSAFSNVCRTASIIKI